jgi:hypothetical protein
VRVVGTNIDKTGSIPLDGVLQVAFDRYLLPITITRQSYVILDGRNQPLPPTDLHTLYDPVARTVTITGPEGPGKAWLDENASYKLVLRIPPDRATDINGFRAIDRAPLLASQTLEFVFRAGPKTQTTTFEPTVDFCTDVLPLLSAKCAGCHDGVGLNSSSLDLSSASGVRISAIGRVAQGANTAARAYLPNPPGSVFGVNTAVVQPGDPGSSWLIYKIELALQPATTIPLMTTVETTNDAGTGTALSVPANFVCQPPAGAEKTDAAADVTPLALAKTQASESERVVLNNYVIGQEMPYPVYGGANVYEEQPFTFQERERIRLWIAQGAQTRECGACAKVPVTAGDAGDGGGAGDAGGSGDAGDAGIRDASDAG